jgi:hypothetical protein
VTWRHPRGVRFRVSGVRRWTLFPQGLGTPAREAEPGRNDEADPVRAFCGHVSASVLWGYQDLNLGPLPYQGSALTV